MARGRKKSPDGRTVPWPVKLSETQAQAAGELCGRLGVARSAWTASLVAAALAEGDPAVRDSAAAIADLEYRLEQALAGHREPRCGRCGTQLACPACQRGDEYA